MMMKVEQTIQQMIAAYFGRMNSKKAIKRYDEIIIIFDLAAMM
jgi:hypothetical protein